MTEFQLTKCFHLIGEEDEEGSREAVFDDSASGDDSTNECESSEEEKDPIEKYKNLLREIEENEKGNESDTELEITWGADGSEASKTKISKKTNDSESEKDETPFERLLRKNKEKSRMKRKKKLEQKEACNVSRLYFVIMIIFLAVKSLLNYFSNLQNENAEKGDDNGKSKSKKNSKGEISEVDELKKVRKLEVHRLNFI